MKLRIRLVLSLDGRPVPVGDFEITSYDLADIAQARALLRKLRAVIRQEFTAEGNPAFN